MQRINTRDVSQNTFTHHNHRQLLAVTFFFFRDSDTGSFPVQAVSPAGSQRDSKQLQDFHSLF
jgi:hypothetical protein